MTATVQGRQHRVMRALATGLLMALIVVTPSAVAETVDVSGDGAKLPEFDVTYVSDDVLAKIAAEDEDAFVDEMTAQWDHCNHEIDAARNNTSWLWYSDGFSVTRGGKCTMQMRPRIGGPEYKLASIDVNKLADAIAKRTSQYSDYGIGDSVLDALQRSEVAGQSASDAAEEAGGGEVAQTGAGLLGTLSSLAGVSQGSVNAVTNPNGQVDQMVNRLKEDSGKAITEGLGYLSQGLAFDGASSTFRQVYAAAASVGLVVLAVGAVWSFARMHKLGLPPEEAVERVLAGLVCGFLGLMFTPALLYVCTDVSNTLTDGVVQWMGATSETITGSLIDPFNALTTANSPLGYLGAIILFILFFIAGLMLIVTFAAQYLAAWFGSVGLGVTWGLVATEKGRQRHKIAATAVVMTIFARPILMFMVGGALVLSGQNTASADGWSTDPMGTLFKLIIALGAILMVCFAPAALLRFVPVGPSHGGGLSRGFTAGLAGGAMYGGMAGSMFGGRMRALSPMIRSAAGRAGRRISGQGGRSRSQQSNAQQAPGKQSDAGKRGTGAAGGKGRGNAEAAQGRGRHAAQPASRGTGAQQPSQRPGQSGQQPVSRPGSTGGPVEAPAVPAASDGGYQPDGGLNALPDTSGTRREASASSAAQAASSRSEPSRVNRDRPGSRLSGVDLLQPASPARRLASGSVRAAGRVGGAAATAAGVAAGTAATAARIGGYQAANWANNVTEDEH